MPIAHLYLMEGRDAEQRSRLIEKVTDAICEAIDARRETVRVLVQEIPNTDWGIGGSTAKELGR